MRFVPHRILHTLVVAPDKAVTQCDLLDGAASLRLRQGDGRNVNFALPARWLKGIEQRADFPAVAL